MNAVNFYKNFIKEVREENIFRDTEEKFPNHRNKSYFEIYKGSEKTFTNLVNKTVIHNILKQDNLSVQHEYLRVDTVGWQGRYEEIEKEEAKKVGINRHLWDLKIAVEHENSKKDWMDELIKLIHIKCPLKVVISYNYCDQREKQELEKIQFVTKWIKEVEAFNSEGDEEYLLILGNGEAKEKKSKKVYEKFDYRGYLYDFKIGEFIKI